MRPLSFYPLVSIIIPVFNDQEGLSRCMRAISQQSYPLSSIEVVIVDNGSDSPVELEEFKGLKTRLLECNKPGSYAARNVGVRSASGEIVAFTDADCWPDECWIKAGVLALSSFDGDCFIGGEVELILPPKPSAVALYQCTTGVGQESNILEKRFTATFNLFCERSLFFSVGLFEERLLSGGDREWSWRAQSKGFSLIFEPEAIIYTEPRRTLKGAVTQARRITAGRKMLNELELAHVGSQHIVKKRSSLQSALWILSQSGLSKVDRVKVFSVALVIRMAESLEGWRLALGGKAERR